MFNLKNDLILINSLNNVLYFLQTTPLIFSVCQGFLFTHFYVKKKPI